MLTFVPLPTQGDSVAFGNLAPGDVAVDTQGTGFLVMRTSITPQQAGKIVGVILHDGGFNEYSGNEQVIPVHCMAVPVPEF